MLTPSHPQVLSFDFSVLGVVFLHRKHLQVSFKVGDEWSTFVVLMYIPYNSENTGAPNEDIVQNHLT